MFGMALFACAHLFQVGLQNGDFSKGLDRWETSVYGAKPVLSTDRISGSPELRAVSHELTDTAFGQNLNLPPGSIYKLSAWIRPQDLRPAGAPVFGALQVQNLDGGIVARGKNHSGTTEFENDAITFVVPPSGRIRIALFMFGFGKGTGSIEFKGVRLDKLNPENLPLIVTHWPLCPARISPLQNGQFIEYLCDLVPSMWAEKLFDGSFEGLTPYKFKFTTETDFKEKSWYPTGQVNRISVIQDSQTKVTGQFSKRLELGAGAPSEAGIAQDGIAVKLGVSCSFTAYAKGPDNGSVIRIRLMDGAENLGEVSLKVSNTWSKVTATLRPKKTASNATFMVTIKGPGTYWLDNLSLMPSDSVGGWRQDVCSALKALKPGIIRVGGSVLDDANLGTFEWTDTIGPVEKRTPFRAWGGLQPIGAGLEEVVQLIQNSGAEPLVCVRYENKTPQDAAKEVEYFNGSVNTPMGKLRAQNGHPNPYAIKYWQIGNERWGQKYWQAVPEFAKAILAVDPKCKLLSSFPSEELLSGAAPYLRYVSPHQYNVADLEGSRQELEATREMISKSKKGKKIKVAVTEWNTTAGDPGLPRAMLWNLANALACCRYQNLMHREADLVEIANRSNLTNSFCSGIIQTNPHSLFLTPTYYSQFLYSNLAGTWPLKIESQIPTDLAPDVSATLSEDRKTLTLFCVNSSLSPITRVLDLSRYAYGPHKIEIWKLGDTLNRGEPDAVNSFFEPHRIVPIHSFLQVTSTVFKYKFDPLNLTVIRLKLD